MARCLTLATYLRQEGASVVFICRALAGNLCDELNSAGFRVHRLPSPPATTAEPGDDDYPKWLGVPWETDAVETSAGLKGERFDWLIVDHYSITASWHRAVAPVSARTMVIDDLAETEMECDLLVNQSIIDAPGNLYERKAPPRCVTLTGPTYALLRPEFTHRHDIARADPATPRHLLISFGGVDPVDLTSRTLRALAPDAPTRWVVETILGPANPRAEELTRAHRGRPGIEIVRGPSDLAKRMSRADLAIGAGGISAWERCCVGLPSLMVSLAPNQTGICEGIARTGSGRYLGEAEAVDSALILAAVSELSEQPEALAAMSTAALSLVDGRGVERVVREMRRIAPGDPPR